MVPTANSIIFFKYVRVKAILFIFSWVNIFYVLSFPCSTYSLMWVFVSDSTVLDKFLDFASEVKKHQGLRPKSKILQPKNEIL